MRILAGLAVAAALVASTPARCSSTRGASQIGCQIVNEGGTITIGGPGPMIVAALVRGSRIIGSSRTPPQGVAAGGAPKIMESD